jgi:formate dehydrogenase
MTWITSVPTGRKRILDRVDRGADLIVLDPCRTAIAAAATTHLALAPGEAWAFVLAMLKIIFDGGLGVTSIDDDGGSLPVFGPANH